MDKAAKSKTDSSFAHGTNDREACPKSWYAVLVQMNTEKKVSHLFDKIGIENYLPVQLEIHQWSDRRKKMERVVIPMVVFIHATSAELKNIRGLSFINKVLSFPGQRIPAIIPDEQLLRLKFMLRHAETEVSLADLHLEVGEEVEIVRGPLRGLRGCLCRIQQDKPMVAVRIEGLGFACVNVAKRDVAVICS